MFRRSWLLLVGTLALGACVEGGSPTTAYQPPGAYPRPPGQPLAGGVGAPSTSAPPGTHVALLAPVTGANAERGTALVQAAQLALSEPGSPALDVHDTGSTPAGAAQAAQAALAGGAGLIIGPLTAAETAAVAPAARSAGVAVLAFTNDAAQAAPGVWTLGITPAQQMRRLVGELVSQGKTRVAALLPPSDFGAAMGTALTQALAAAGAPPPDIHTHDGTNQNIANTLRDLSGYDSRRGPIDAQIKAATAKHTAEGRKEAAELRRRAIPPPSFDALVMADTGEKLAWAASFLEYYDLSTAEIRILGPALWASPAARGGAQIGGAWYAAPDPSARAGFDAAYQAKYGSPAPGLADVAYDAAAIARVLAGSGGFSAAALCRPQGFAGADGVLALQADGTVRRGLAIFAIHGGGPTIVEPAPTDLATPGT
jgi:ABC-type branched-subunit amino acid transport system substrate-binding protein